MTYQGIAGYGASKSGVPGLLTNGFTSARVYNDPSDTIIQCEVRVLTLIDLQAIGDMVQLLPPPIAEYGDISGAMLYTQQTPYSASFANIFPGHELREYGEGIIIQLLPVTNGPVLDQWLTIADVLAGPAA